MLDRNEQDGNHDGHEHQGPAPGNRDQRGHAGGQPGPSVSLRPLSWLLPLLILLAVLVFLRRSPPGEEVAAWSDFATILKEDGVQAGSVVVENELVRAKLKPDYTYEGIEQKDGESTAVYVPIDAENRDFYLERLHQLDGNTEHELAWEVQTSTGSWWQMLLLWGPALLFLGFLVLTFTGARRAMGQGPAGMLGRFSQSPHAQASRETVDVTLEDVAGVDEAKQEVAEVVRFLGEPVRFRDLGVHVPRGVLLTGPPGCGKTLLARAIAGEADVPFYSISGSDFMEMFVGVGASRVRDLFKQAKQNAPCIVFLDEIDAIGRRRGSGWAAGGGHGEREQTLNAVLSEMDGFEPHEEVVVLAATNRPDVLDPALTRPGRFDRQVTVPLPDARGRREILEIHASRVKLADDVDLEHVARTTVMFSGADLRALVNEAGILAATKGKDRVDSGDVEQARDKVRFGRARRSRRFDESQRERNAYHEAGHALLQATLEEADPIDKVTIIPRGQALGATMALPETDRYGYGRRYLQATLRVMCGGRIAEERHTGDVSSGAADDIGRATELARKMVVEWGMSERVGFLRFADDDRHDQIVATREYSEQTAREIDDEIKRLVDEAYGEAERVIDERWGSVEAIARELLEEETLSAADVHRCLAASGSDDASRPSSDAEGPPSPGTRTAAR